MLPICGHNQRVKLESNQKGLNYTGITEQNNRIFADALKGL
jgi:hypothetical protein